MHEIKIIITAVKVFWKKRREKEKLAQVDKAAIKAENKVVGLPASPGLDMLTGTAANPVACFTTCLGDASGLHWACTALRAAE